MNRPPHLRFCPHPERYARQWWVDERWDYAVETRYGYTPAQLGLKEHRSWRVSRGGPGDAVIVWLYRPSWAARDPAYVERNIAAHEQIVRGEAKIMGLKAVWIRKELHRTTRITTWKNVRPEKLTLPAPPHITVWAGETLDRVHWHGHWNCIEVLGEGEETDLEKIPSVSLGRGVQYLPDGRYQIVRLRPTHKLTGMPFRIEVSWNPTAKPRIMYTLGEPKTPDEERLIPEPLKPGEVYMDGYCPPNYIGTKLEPFFSVPRPGTLGPSAEKWEPPSEAQYERYKREGIRALGRGSS